MGFRSVFVSEDIYIQWPEWFCSKWERNVHFRNDRKGTISSKVEGKTYGIYEEIPTDVQRVVSEQSGEFIVGSVDIIFFHECGGITKCAVYADKIIWSEPTGWAKTDWITHNYCYGCSDVQEQQEAIGNGQ